MENPAPLTLLLFEPPALRRVLPHPVPVKALLIKTRVPISTAGLLARDAVSVW